MRVLIASTLLVVIGMATPAVAESHRERPHNIPVRCILHVDRHGNGSIGHCHTI